MLAQSGVAPPNDAVSNDGKAIRGSASRSVLIKSVRSAGEGSGTRVQRTVHRHQDVIDRDLAVAVVISGPDTR